MLGTGALRRRVPTTPLISPTILGLMGDSAEPVGDVHTLGQSRIWPAIAIPGAAAIAMIIVAVVLRYVSWYAMGAVAASLIVALTRRRNAVLGDDIGLLIRARGRLSRSYAWSQIERIGWRDAGIWGSTLQVYPRGGPYDVPGPNSSTDVGRIWRPRRRHPSQHEAAGSAFRSSVRGSRGSSTLSGRDGATPEGSRSPWTA